ncbi:MAG: hypothetical protein GY792_17685 [Gammaproteobacteria bacterium]|nr:hypothetical protein [Gammaproteobacteria bacterium]
MIKQCFWQLPLVVALSACASTSTIPLAQDTVQITARAAPACGGAGAEKVALKQSAVETINRGYDRFVVVNAAANSSVRVVGHTPVHSTTTGSATIYGNTAFGTANTTTYGGTPIYGGAHNQGLIVKMFKSDDPASANALDARTILGPEWEKTVKETTLTCL